MSRMKNRKHGDQRIAASFVYSQANLYEIVLPSFSPPVPDSMDLQPIPDDILPCIREDEFGSLVSFALNSPDYRKQSQAQHSVRLPMIDL